MPAELPATPVGERLAQVLDAMRAGTLDEPMLRELVAESFLTMVGPAQLLEIARQVHPLLAVADVDWVDARSTPTSLSAELAGDTPGIPVVALTISVEEDEPHRIAGLMFRPIDPNRPMLGPVADLPARDVRSRADEGFDESLAAELVDALERFVATGQVGLAAAVVVDGRVWTAEAGLASVEAARRVDQGTIFRAYSISKTVTAEALLTLDLDLDDPAEQHLTSLRLVPPEGAAPPTIRQLLTHAAGVSSKFEHWVEHVVPVAEQLGAEWPCETAPGTAWAYSNGGYATLGQLVEDVAGRPFEDVVAEAVLRPLGMVDSEFRSTNAIGDRWAVGYDVRRGEVAPADATVPSVLGAGSLFTTATDLARFASAVSTADDAAGRFTSQIPELGQEQGLAWRLVDVDGRRWGAHGGGGHGFSTMLAVLPQAGAGIVLLTNIGGQVLEAPTTDLQRAVQRHVG